MTLNSQSISYKSQAHGLRLERCAHSVIKNEERFSSRRGEIALGNRAAAIQDLNFVG